MQSATMKMKMRLIAAFGLAVLSVAPLASGQAADAVAAPSLFPSEPYEFMLSKVAADEGRYDEALSRIDRVIDKVPTDPVLQFERAMILIDSGRIERAETELRRLTETHPDFYDAQRIFGRILLDRAGNDRSRMDEALRHLSAAYQSNPDDLPTGVTVSQILVALGRSAEAERVLSTLVERAPDQRVINFNYAQVLTKLGRGDESRPYLERAVRIDPTFVAAVMQLLDIYQRQNEWEKAAALLQPLIEEEPINIELRRQQAYFYLRAGEPEKARTGFQSLVDGDPKDFRSRFYLAEALNDLELFGDADRIYRELLEKNPNDPDLLSSFGLAQIGQRKYDEAEKTFKALLALEGIPDNLVALAKTQLALIELQRGNNAAAVAAARTHFVFRDKPNVQAINIALDALRKEKRYQEALDILQPLVDRFAGDAFVNARYIEMQIRLGNKERAQLAAATQAKFGSRNIIATAEAMVQAGASAEAAVYIGAALKEKPEEIDLQFEMGSLLERSGDHAGAERAFLRILETKPEHAATLNYLGYMWADRNMNLDRAAEMLTRAVSQEPRNGAYVDSLGWVYYRQGKLDLARKHLIDAARLLPRDATVHEHLGDVLAKQGDHARALESYRAALQLEPGEKLRSKIADVERQVKR